ncbi:MAG: SDR family NAD(P)-dependent oxidoreductase [Polyangiales bacterium]
MGEAVLVTGGAGFIGSHLVDALLRRGDRVRVLDDLLPQAHPTGAPRHLSKGAELLVGDLRDPTACARALEGIDVVHHLGGMVGNGQSMIEVRRYMDVNGTGTATLLEEIGRRRDRVRRLVVASSMVVYGDGAYVCAEHGRLREALRPKERLESRRWEPICPTCCREVTAAATREDDPLRPTSTYGVSKLAQEELSLALGRAYAVPTIALRYLNVYGSRQALSNPYTGVAAIMTSRLRNGRPPTVFEDGGQLRDFVHVLDIVRANLAAADAGAEAFGLPINVATGRSVRILDVARMLAAALGVPLDPLLTGEFREGDIRHCFADTTRARKVLGFETAVRFEDGIGELVAWASGETPEDRTEAANAELRARALIR